MPSFQSPRGTRDILPAEQAVWRHVRTVAEEIAFQMGYKPITTPTYEEIGLFQRAIGEGTDIQDKELFLVRGIQGEAGQEPYALRPEATAGIVRSYIEHGMHTWPGPVKLFTFSNNFRYDRPQKGRYREHVQFDIEYFGETGPFADAWIIFTTWRFLTKLGLTGLELRLNSLGSADERVAFVSALQDYYGPLQDQLSEDSKRRLSTNPLRILDSKDPKDHALRENAPRLSDMFGEESSSHFAEVQTLLEEWGIPKDSVILDPFLVRGLDYYSHTAFEWTVASEKGQQASLGGGGRYDGLLPKLEGPAVGAVGAGIGLDRIVEELARQGKTEDLSLPSLDAYMAAADEIGHSFLKDLLPNLLENNISVDCNFSKPSLGAQMKAAAKSGARYAIVAGEQEVSSQTALIKDLSTGEQETVALDQIATYVRKK